MVFTKKKSRRSQNAGGLDLSDQALNDSVRAAQVIFQKHASSQPNVNESSSSSSSQQFSGTIVSPQPKYKRNSGSQAYLLQNGRSSSSQIRRGGLSPLQGNYNVSNISLQRSESAQTAAQLAAAHWNQTDERESQTHSRISASKIPSDRNNETRKVSNDRTNFEATRLPSQSQLAARHQSQTQMQPQLLTGVSHASTQPRTNLETHLPSRTSNQSQIQSVTHLQHTSVNNNSTQAKPQPPAKSKSLDVVTTLNSTRGLKSPSTISVVKRPTIPSVILSATSTAKGKENRTLTGRIPPPNIYLNKDVGSQIEAGSEENLDHESFEFYPNENDPGDLYSLNSIPSSGSYISLITDRTSFDGNSPQDGDDGSDVDDETDETDETDEKSYDRFTGEVDEMNQEDDYDSDYTYAQQSDLSSSSLTPSINANYDSTAAAVTANATYGKITTVSHPNVTYQGTLPDLIPNHVRQSRMEKFKTKIFGSRNKHKNENNIDQFSGKSSVTSNEYGRPVVTTNQNLRFKTTMRGKDTGTSNDRTSNNFKENNGSETYNMDADEYSDESSSDSDYDSNERNEEKRKHKRTYRLKRKLKNTAVVPYKHHLHHYDHRSGHRDRTFNEDKPWKSHNDVGFVTSQERKRYEGMWVSNRCLYLELLPWWDGIMTGKEVPSYPLPEDGLMLNIVVKDIWMRSNLPNDLLAQIYEKVDTRKDGTLDRKSFIVGMWLVDQCLYGRKLPREIDQQIWDSVDRYIVNVINPSTIKHMGKTKKRQLKQEIKNIKKEIKNTHL